MASIEKHPHWLARGLDEDFGVDAEAEFIPAEARGDILKLQFKASEKVVIKKGKVLLRVERKYLEYARACRYPVIFVQADVQAERAWYLWLQKWMLDNQPEQANGWKSQSIWVNETQTLQQGLGGELQAVAQWRGPTQLALSLLDAFRAALATNNQAILKTLSGLLDLVAPALPDIALNEVVERAIQLGNRLRGTHDGNTVASQMYDLVRKFGARINLHTIDAMVRRDDLYSRAGVNALGILYDEHYDHATKLGIVEHFIKDLPEVAYFSALREAHPEKKDLDFMMDGPGDFQYAGLRFHFDGSGTTGFHDKYANRGSSAILDFLVPVATTKIR
jgi:hypothetical protein